MHAVRPGELEQLAAHLERVTGELIDALEEADAASRRLHGAWEGEAASAHAEKHGQWKAHAQRMSAALAEVRQVIATAQSNYSAAAAVNTSMWGGA